MTLSVKTQNQILTVMAYQETRHLIKDGFFSQSSELRAHFEERFAEPRSTARNRFVWDYWHVPGQYTLLRTPAWEFFPEDLYVRFHEHLVKWGRSVLGCHDISPPWLSLYVEGCSQETHADLPHGPWAWVYSLSPVKKEAKKGALQKPFIGGDTCLLSKDILNYWQDYAPRFASGKMLESDSMWEKISPVQNRLTVFDPRIPHQVSEVRGVRDPLQGRLVIHGWFVQPRPFIQGKISAKRVEHWIAECSQEIETFLAATPDLGVQGVLTFRIETTASGAVKKVEVLTSSLVSPFGVEAVRPLVNALKARLLRSPLKSGVKSGGGAGVVTLPLVFGA